MTRSVLTVLFSIIGLTQYGSPLGSENTREINMIHEISIPF